MIDEAVVSAGEETPVEEVTDEVENPAGWEKKEITLESEKEV